MSASQLDAASNPKKISHHSRRLNVHPNTIIRWCRDGVALRNSNHVTGVRSVPGWLSTDRGSHRRLPAITADRANKVKDAPTTDPGHEGPGSPRQIRGRGPDLIVRTATDSATTLIKVRRFQFSTRERE